MAAAADRLGHEFTKSRVPGSDTLAEVCNRYAERLRRAAGYAESSATFLGRGLANSDKRTANNERNGWLGGRPPRQALIKALPESGTKESEIKKIKRAPARFLAYAMNGRSIAEAVQWLRTPNKEHDGVPIDLDRRLMRKIGETKWPRIHAARSAVRPPLPPVEP